MSSRAFAMAALLAGPVAAAAQSTVLPLEPGLTWTYRGHVRWTGDDRRVHRDAITWTMKIVAVRNGPNARVALVSGWVRDLAGYEPSKTPRYSTLVVRDGRLYHVAASDSAGAVADLDAAVRADAQRPQLSDLVLDSALTVGQLYGRDSATSKRDDTMYGWYVASETTIAAPAAWKAVTRRVKRLRLEYRTVPDHESIDLVPGLGITRFVYIHHGTVAETDVRLISVTR